MTATQNPFVWYELITTDVAAAREFYTGVTGWSAEVTEIAGPPYTMFSAGGAPVAGMIDRTHISGDASGMPPCWTGFVGVQHVDAKADEAVRLGGALLVPGKDLPNVGRFAVIGDPQGAAIALFKPHQECVDAPPAPPNAIGRIAWHELMATNMETAFAFYETLFGWQKSKALEMGPMGTYQLFSIGGQDVGGMMSRPPQVPGPFWLYYVNVGAIDDAVSRVTAGGGQVMNGPMQVPGGTWIAQCQDPQGAMFAMAGTRD